MHTPKSVAAALATAGVPFRLDESRGVNPLSQRALKFKDSLPLVCTNRLKNDTECGYPVRHTVGNILNLMKPTADLYCQGPCDAKRKGKSLRIKLAPIEKELVAARAGTYTLVPGSYVMKTEPALLTHNPCGQTQLRDLELVITFPGRMGLPPETDRDCVFCTGRAARLQLVDSPEQYREWLLLATDGAIEYRSGSLVVTDKDTVPLVVVCLDCGTEFTALESRLRQNAYHSCPTCTDEALHAQRAWVLIEAQELVARRGFILEDDPESYIAPATLLTSTGEPTGYQNILSLVRALPATAAGFGKAVLPALTAGNTGQPYTAAELDLIWTAQREKRSKVWLCRELGRSYGSVSQKCRKLGLSFDEDEHCTRRMNVDDLFFSTPTPRSAYWGGLLVADGCLGKEITIELKACDEGVLVEFLRELGHPGALSYRVETKATEGRGLYAGLRFRSGPITRDLQKWYRLTRRKSKTLEPPDLADPAQILAYLGGLIDGDGAIKLDRDGGLRVRLVSASLTLATWVQEQVSALLGVETTLLAATPRGLKIYELAWHGAKAAQVLQAVAAVTVSPMRRKWQVYEGYQASCDNATNGI